jgi:pimeloyl-ACP methyl ester carboxylesterase
MDYGAPVGYRMFAALPERVSAFIIQNGNAHEEGLREFWDPIRAYWADPSAENSDKLRAFLTLDATNGSSRMEPTMRSGSARTISGMSSICWTGARVSPGR